MQIQALLCMVLALAANAVLAICNTNMVNGNWALLASGQTPSIAPKTANLTQNINVIGMLTLKKGVVTNGWIVAKTGSNITDATNVTGNYTVVFPCVIQLNVSSVVYNTTITKFAASYRGTIALNGLHISLISLKPNTTVVAQMNQIPGKCNANSLHSVWTGSAIRTYPTYTVPVLETIDCSVSKTWCNIWEFGSNYSATVNGTRVNVTMNADGKHPCMWTFQNGTVANGYIAVPFGAGMNIIEATSSYSYAATYYKGEPLAPM